MSDRSASFLDGLKNPEYTGENRCVPCTIVNALIAVAASGIVFLAFARLGAAVLAVSALLIYFRGYLVPGTPELTKRYLPARVLALFGKDPIAERRETEIVSDAADDGAETGSGDETDSEELEFETLKRIKHRRENSVEPVPFLREAGVLPPDDDHSLSEEFADRTHERMVAYRDREIETAVLGEIFGTEPDNIEDVDREYPAYEVDKRIRKWPSEGAWIADVATHEVLTEYTDQWMDLPIKQRAEILEWLRGLQDACPLCDGDIRFSDDVIESCCGRFEVTTVACADCGERLREFSPTKVGTREELKGITP